MLVGYNHNIRHKGKMYHVQTEDSGSPGLYINTLLYIEGTIIASKKTEYSELAKKKDYEPELKILMQNQHKELLINLRDGAYDDPAQASLVEPDEVRRKDELSILDAINSMEKALFDDIIKKGKKREGLPYIKEAGKGIDEAMLNYLSQDLKSKDEEA